MGTIRPLFYYILLRMIQKDKVGSIVLPKLQEDGYFLVEVTVSTANKIIVTIDSFDGVSIDYIVELSRFIESNLDREEEDFDLEVSSPGLSLPFVVLEQYQKCEGSEVEVVTAEGIKLEGVMKLVTDQGITLQVATLEKVEGKKRKQEIVREHVLPFDKINSTKLVITFK